MAVQNNLWSLAEQAAPKNPKRAGEIARASLMLCALTDYNQGWTGLLRVRSSPEGTQKLLALKDAQYKQLFDLVAERAKRLTAIDGEQTSGFSVDAIRLWSQNPDRWTWKN